MKPIELSVHESVREIGEAAWAGCLPPEAPPFLKFDWFDILERTGCVGSARGWVPNYLSLRQGGELFAVVPAFLKANSEGEFVFDHSWAQFAQTRLGIGYYPKLIVAVPFTPATSERVVSLPNNGDAALAGAAEGLRLLVERFSLSSAHVLFCTEAEQVALEKLGLTPRVGLQFHWRNRGYQSFDEFLARFSSKRRNQLKRERRALVEQGIQVDVLEGEQLTPAMADLAYTFYVSTVDKFVWGRRYLNRSFFEEVFAKMNHSVQLVVARDVGSKKPIAGAFNLRSSRALYGRYWGAVEDRPFLHFNVCYYRGIEYAIDHGLALFEPGAGGEHKLARGFEPTLTYSAHHLPDSRFRAVVSDFCQRERHAIEAEIAEAAQNPVIRA